jgi:hypothetical protein
MADQRKPEIIDIGGWRWKIDEETQALYFIDDEESFAEAVAYLREVNQLETMALAAMPQILADARSEEATKITLPPPGSAPQA